MTLPKRKFSAIRPPTDKRLNRNGPDPVEVATLIEDISLRYYFKADRGLDVKSQTDEGIPMGVMIDVQFLVEGQIVPYAQVFDHSCRGRHMKARQCSSRHGLGFCFVGAWDFDDFGGECGRGHTSEDFFGRPSR